MTDERERAAKAAKYAAEKMARAAARKKKRAQGGEEEGLMAEFKKATTGDAKVIAKTLRSRFRRSSRAGPAPGAMQGELASILARRKQKSGK